MAPRLIHGLPDELDIQSLLGFAETPLPHRVHLCAGVPIGPKRFVQPIAYPRDLAHQWGTWNRKHLEALQGRRARSASRCPAKGE